MMGLVSKKYLGGLTETEASFGYNYQDGAVHHLARNPPRIMNDGQYLYIKDRLQFSFSPANWKSLNRSYLIFILPKPQGDN